MELHRINHVIKIPPKANVKQHQLTKKLIKLLQEK